MKNDSCLGYDEDAGEAINTEKDCECLLANLLMGGLQIEDLVPQPEVMNFDAAGLMTTDRGVCIRFANGAEFQITVKRSR
jgi:hypothetical protein